jgi:hypothetical protein
VDTAIAVAEEAEAEARLDDDDGSDSTQPPVKLLAPRCLTFLAMASEFGCDVAPGSVFQSHTGKIPRYSAPVM